jgi:uncharacterized protein YegL
MISKKLSANDEVFTIPGPAAFQFSGVQISDDTLGAMEYTLAGLAWDKSGSVTPFAAELDKCLKECIAACRKCPRNENLMLRMLHFNNDVDEVFGWKELKDIDENKLPKIRPNGSTALFDATYNIIGATLEYSKKMIEKFYSCNGIIFVMTDGDDNASTSTKASIRKLIASSQQKEVIDSLVTILIRMEDPSDPMRAKEVKRYLDSFYKEVGFDAFVDMGQVTPGKLAKLAQFVSQSVSSSSASLITKQKSIPLTPTF